uniref:Uncharacterized protein n=1 Tax=Pyxicephalus adspersus TaxID=30357 RepID=A0AAV3AJL9_PYXAD|nr:TPA: hypothetical protein GDO54_007472 [Pyxicephalus adspersus]
MNVGEKKFKNVYYLLTQSGSGISDCQWHADCVWTEVEVYRVQLFCDSNICLKQFGKEHKVTLNIPLKSDVKTMFFFPCKWFILIVTMSLRSVSVCR